MTRSCIEPNRLPEQHLERSPQSGIVEREFMASSPQDVNQLREIQKLLSALRWRIRAYIWLEGICVALVWLGATFWASLAIDYLPVLAGANEMPRAARAVLLVGIAGTLGWILYRWVARRAFERLPDRSLAVVIERRFQSFRDSLVTTVELSKGQTTDYSPEMLAQTVELARAEAEKVRLSQLFNLRPLAWSSLLAVLLCFPIGLFYARNAAAWELLLNRIYLLRDEPWPRQAQIEVVGMEVQATGKNLEALETPLRRFENQQLRVARGGSLKLIVHAQENANVVPELCTVYYRTESGIRGSINMNRIGRPKDGFQRFEYLGPPFVELSGGLTFDVLGYDHRLRNFEIIAVDSPEVVAAELDCTFPEYMVNEAQSLWQARTVGVTPGMKLPQGTRLVLRGQASKDLRRVLVRRPEASAPEIIEIPETAVDRRQFTIALGELNQDLRLDLILHDTDEVTTMTPHSILVGALEDRPPEVNTRISGIGSLITPDAIVPYRGKVEDDYGVARTWLETLVNDQAPTEHDVELKSGGQVQWGQDFRVLRSSGGLALKPKDRLVLQMKARDHHDLGTGPNMGAGDRVELTVVTPEELLFDLEKKEIDKRRRLEQIISEMTETRDALLRVRSDSEAAQGAASDAPRDDTAAAAAEAVDARARALRVIRVQRGVQQAQKSSQETLGVAAAVRDICEELLNNRLDAADRRQRLEAQVAEPLQMVGDVAFPQLDGQLKALSELLEKINRAQSDPAEADAAVDEVVAKTNELLRRLETVLNSMLDLESYNELLDIVRALLDEQERILNETKKQQKKQALDLLK